MKKEYNKLLSEVDLTDKLITSLKLAKLIEKELLLLIRDMLL